MKKIISIMLCSMMIYSFNNCLAFAEELPIAEKVEYELPEEYEDYALMSEDLIKIDGVSYLQSVYKLNAEYQESVNKNDNAVTDVIESNSYYTVLRASPSATVYAKELSYAYTFTINEYYSTYTVSGNKYYKINRMDYTLTGLESPCVMNSVTLRLYNNGMNDSKVVRGQSASKSIGTASSGTIYGESGWTYATSYSQSDFFAATGFYVEYSVTRGSTVYSGVWKDLL